MAKRQKQTAKGENTSDSKDGIDRLSILPDELLVSILSLLTLKEATATSILSRRWRYLWTLLVKLDFDGKESLLKVLNAASESTLDEERCNYVGWVDDVMSTLQHKGSLSSIEEFRVFFNLTRVHKKRIDKWLQHAVADNKKKIRRLELKLVNYFHTKSREDDECYTFPDKLLLSGNNFEFLKSLSLYYVNVNGEALECLLCNSLHLEELSVSRSGRLSALKIIRPCPSFKRLEISLCHNLNSVEIRHSKIVYLKYEGFRIHHFVLENVPFLVELCIGGVLTARMRHVLAMFASYLPQLEIFKIDFYTCITWKETAMFYSAVKMNNLKQLVVEFSIDESVSLLPLTNLICASPCLQRFVLEASHCYSDFERIRTMRTETVRRPYHRLEVVEFVEYRGAICELELITHILENVVVLKEIRVDPHLRDEWYNWDFLKTTQDKMGARARAKNQLTKIVPPNINLKIL